MEGDKLREYRMRHTDVWLCDVKMSLTDFIYLKELLAERAHSEITWETRFKAKRLRSIFDKVHVLYL